MSSEFPLPATDEAVRVIPLEYAPPEENPSKTRILICWSVLIGWLCAVVAWVLIVAVDVESVMITGPILTLIGLTIAIAAGRLRAVWPLIVGLSHIAICVLFVVMINIWNLNPRSAYAPFTVVGAIYCVAVAAPTAMTLFRPRFDLRDFIPQFVDTDLLQDLNTPLRKLLGYELMQGNVIERVERNRWTRCPLVVTLREPLHFKGAQEQIAVPMSICRWENNDPRFEPQAGWKCSITLQSLGGPTRSPGA